MSISRRSVYHTRTSGNVMSRLKLLEWINSFLDAGHVSKVEELCTGVAYCFIISTLGKGCINLKKVKRHPRTIVDFIHNLKLFQNAFTALNFEKDVPIQDLIKGKYEDNLEFLQWFHKFYLIVSDKHYYYQDEFNGKKESKTATDKTTKSRTRTTASGINQAVKKSAGITPKPLNAKGSNLNAKPSIAKNTEQTPNDAKDEEERALYFNKVQLRSYLKNLKDEKKRLKEDCISVCNLAHSSYTCICKIREVLNKNKESGQYVDLCNDLLCIIENRDSLSLRENLTSEVCISEDELLAKKN